MFCSVLFLLNSCKNEFQLQKISQIDSLQIFVSIVQNKLNNNDTLAYKAIYNQIKLCTSVYKEYAIELPKDPQFRNRFVTFTQLEKSYKRLLKEYKLTLIELHFASKQLDDLESDLKSNVLKDQNKITEYIHQESDAVKNLAAKTDDIFKRADLYKTNYNKLKEEMEAFAENLKNTSAKK